MGSGMSTSDEKLSREERLAAKQGQKKEIGWGSQIRSYVLQPYQLAKDHRTGLEVGDVEGVLDGNLDRFAESYLKWVAGGRKPTRTASGKVEDV